jgi:hypothetical protein
MLEIKAPGMPDMLVPIYDQYKLLEPYRPWESEPDNAEWVDADTGLHGRIWRNTITHTLCGYVGVTTGDLVGVDYNRVSMNDYSPHGGLTYSGREGNVWWFGFDCAHSEDFLPGIYIKMRMVNHKGKDSWPPTTNYRTWEFVDAEIRKMMEAIALKRYTIEAEKGD